MGIATFLALFLLSTYSLSSLGIFKFWYITQPIGTMYYPKMMSATLPFGIVFAYVAIMPFLPNYDPDSFYVDILIGLMLIGFLSLIWTPKFLRPKWVRTLEREYGYCLPILIEEARNMGRWQWESRVRTPAQLQSWLDQTLTHRQADIDPLWQEYRRHMQRKHGRGNFHIPQHRRKQ